MILEYYKKAQADQFTFIPIPQVILTDERFSEVSMEAKVLYGMLLKRMSLSTANRWIDEKKRAYVVYPVYKIQEDIGISKGKSVSCLQELEMVGLIERIHRGQGLPSIIYLKNFIIEEQSSEV